MKPSQDKILAELEWLKTNKEKLPRFDFYGDDRYAAIERQIKILESGECPEERQDNNASRAWAEHDAWMWLRGYSQSRPSEYWRSLLAVMEAPYL